MDLNDGAEEEERREEVGWRRAGKVQDQDNSGCSQWDAGVWIAGPLL